MLRTTVGIFNAAAASWEKNPKLGFGGAATQIPTPIIRQYDGDCDDFDDDDDDYMHIMMKCALVCLWVMKNDHFLKRGGWVPPWVTKNDHFLKKVSWPPRSVKKWSLSQEGESDPHVSHEKGALSQSRHLKDQLVPPGSDKNDHFLKNSDSCILKW